jgi:uncharacterized Zn-finger protein
MVVTGSFEFQGSGSRGSSIHIFDEVSKAGFCSNPIHLGSRVVDHGTGEIGQSSYRVACKNRRELICASCSRLYKADAWILVAAGLAGGKGIPASVAGHPRVFLTLTAPSFGAVHTIRTDGSCTAAGALSPRATCRHGRLMLCPLRHEPGDPELGSPICTSCHDDTGAVSWNWNASALRNRTVVRLR